MDQASEQVSFLHDPADAAWVSLELPLAVAGLRAFLGDVGRLLRINPLVEYHELTTCPDGSIHLVGRNESNGQLLDVDADVVRGVAGIDLLLRYRTGVKQETRIAVAASDGGAVITVTEVYAPPAPDSPEFGAAYEAIDRSLVSWAGALRTHLLRRRRWAWLPGYCRFVDHFWLAMPPRQRRLAWLITWTSLVEFAVFAAVLAVFLAAR